MEFGALRAEVATAVRILHQAGLIQPFGHVSARTDDGRAAILSHLHGGNRAIASITAGDVTLVDLNGNPSPGMAEPPEEVHLHTQIYRYRPDVKAVAHFHPFSATALGAAGKPVLPVFILCEAFDPSVPIYPYSEQVDTPADGARLAEFLGDRRAAVLRWHGAVTCGGSIAEATVLALNLEEAARMQLATAAIGGAEPVGGLGGSFPESYRSRRGYINGVWANWLTRITPAPIA